MEALRVPGDLANDWRALGPAIRGYLGQFLTLAAPAHAPEQVAALATGFPGFHDDLAAGGPRLCAAFPGLVRTLVAIERGDDRLEVRIACEGAHDGPFFDFMLATGRAVRFVEIHRLQVRAGRIVEDQIAIDLRAIIRQLATVNRG